MGKSSSSRTDRADSEISSRSERRRTQDDTDDAISSRRRSQADSVTSSNTRRRSQRRDDDERDDRDQPRSQRYASQDYTGSTVPSSYNGQADTDVNDRSRKSASDPTYGGSRREERREKNDSRNDRGSTRALEDETQDRRDSGRSKRRDSKRDSTSTRRSERDERSRALDDHDASLPQNQFPGSFPDTNTQPYRPPGQAADYYGDQGESVQYQPGVRPQAPAYVTNAEQAHLHAPSTEAAPPPEPSTLGQAGAAASYFASGDSDVGAPQSAPSRPPIMSSPKAEPTRPGRVPSNGGSVNLNGVNMAAAGMAAGAAASYFANSNAQSSSQSYQTASSYGQNQASSQYTNYQGDAYSTTSPQSAIKPSGSSSNYAGMAAAGLAGAAAAGYYAHQHNHNHEHENGHQSYSYPQGGNSTFVVGQGQSAFPAMQQQLRHKHRGPLTKLADWFRDPQGVSQFEQYSEATGVCKYCFDPNTTAADAPRKHYYHKTRPVSQPGKYGAVNRIEKPYRPSSSSSSSSDDDQKKRKRSSNGAKLVAGGIAAYGAAKVGEAMFKQQNNFDDTYSVKSGQPITPGASQVTVNRVDYADADMYGSGSRRRSSKGSRYVSEDIDLKRKDSTSSRRSRRDEDAYGEKKRSSRRRESNSSPSGLSRGAAMSVGAVAGAAGIAALAASERRRSRSRSRSRERAAKLNRKRSYYSKRVSPRHSYVDLSKRASGSVGFGQFFSSPSANEKRGRKKGLFTWTNDSSSSSDADLAFGEGTVKRKSGKQEKTRKGSYSAKDDTAAILGLAATGAALAAESDRRKSKSRYDTNNTYAAHGSRRASTNKIRLQDQSASSQIDGDGVWEDASDDDMSSDSVDTALAYGGRLSNRNSRESLAEQGTSKWAWRWTPNKEKQTSKDSRRETPSNPQTPKRDTYELASAGLAGAVGAGAGFAAANMMKPDHPEFASATPSPLPPMQFVEPFAQSDANLYDARKISRFDGPSPRTVVSRSPAPLQQPQAVNAPSNAPIPAVLNKLEADARMTDSPTEITSSSGQGNRERRVRNGSVERTRRKRRDSSPPPVNPSNISRNSVSWDLTTEQLENERRAREKQEKRRLRRREDSDRDRLADSPTTDRKDLKEDRATASRQDSLDKHQDRRSEIDRELQVLYAEHQRQMEEQKMLDEYRRSHGETGGIAAAVIGAGVGAAATAMVTDSKKNSESDSDKKPRRKSSLKRGSVDDTSSPAPIREPTPPKESQQERIAKMTAQRKKDSSSPAHEDYASFFLPKDVAEHVKEHNDAAEKREHDREVIDLITPEMLSASRMKPRFDSWLYSPYRPGKPHQPDYHPRGVPRLDLIEATPPGSPGGLRHSSASSPLSQKPMGTEDVDVVAAPLDGDATSSASSAKEVKWGDNSKHVYEVETPEYERNDPTGELAKGRTVEDEEIERIIREERERRARDAETPKAKEEFHKDRSPDPSPMDERSQEDSLGGQPYQKPFYESISDIGEIPVGDEKHRDIPKTGPGFAVSLPVSPVDEKKQPQQQADGSSKGRTSVGDEVLTDEVSSDARPSRTERRRLERAMSSSENVTPTVEPSKPLPTAAMREDSAGKQMPGGFGVFDYLVDDEGKQMTPEANRQIEATAASTLSRRSQDTSVSKADEKSKGIDEIDFPKPKRAATFGDAQVGEVVPKSGAEYASDPEDWERSTKKRSKKDRSSKSRSEVGTNSRDAFAAVAAGAAAAAAAATARKIEKGSEAPMKETASAVGSEPDYYAATSKDKKQRRSKRESEIFDDYDNKSVVSLPATKDEDRKSRRRSKRDSEAFDDDNDDDTKSVTSMPATRDEDGRSKRRSKEKEKEQEKGKRSSGIFGGIFSSNKSDVSASSKKSSKSSRSDSRNNRDDDEDKEKRRKRRSKSIDDYEQPISIGPDTKDGSERRRRKSEDEDDLIKSSPSHTQDPSIDDGFVSADDGQINSHQTKRYDNEDQSFLVKSLEMPPPTVTDMPMVIDGVSGPTISERQIPNEDSRPDKARDVTEDIELPPLPAQDDAEEATLNAPLLTDTPSTQRTRRLSALRTSDVDPVPTILSSPTAVPLPFGRRGPFTPSSAQRPAGSPSITSPLSTPRTRMNRPKSTSGKDFKPLYLVERHSYQKTGTPEQEEDLPSLPSSRTSSAHPSMEDLRGTAELQADPEASAGRGRRHSYSSIDDHVGRRQSPDYLDSRAATPVPGDKQKAREREMLEIRERKEKEKQWKSLFHSPSELLQDPALNKDVEENIDIERMGSPLPSVVSTDHDQEFMSAESRPESPLHVADYPVKRQLRQRSPSIERYPVTQSESPNSRSEPRSKSGEMAAIAGLGIAGGVLAATSRVDKDDQPQEAAVREVSVEDTKTIGTDDVLSEATTGKKGKKDKKKKRKTLDLSDPSWSEITPEQAGDNLSPEQGEVPSRGAKGLPMPTESFEPVASSKKSKKEKRKSKSGKASDEQLSAIDITAARNADLRDLDEPTTALPTVDHDADTKKGQGSDSTEAFAAALTSRILADKDIVVESSRSETTLPQYVSDNVPTSDNNVDRSVVTKERFVPTVTLMNQADNQLGAFEEAFERAIRARGLKSGVNREDAMQVFLPKRDNAPFVPKPGLTPVPEGSPASLVTRANELGQREINETDEGFIKRKLSKKEKRKSNKSNLSNPETPVEITQYDESYEPLSAKNPFGDDFEIKPAFGNDTSDRPVVEEVAADFSGPTPLQSTEESRELEDQSQQNAAEANVDDFYSVSSKKDKKKKRKSQPTALTETTLPTEPDAPTDVAVADASREITETSTPVENEWDQTTTKKGKKSKKTKKGQAQFDWTDIAAIAAAGAVGGTAGALANEKLAAGDTGNPRELVTEPQVSKDDATAAIPDRNADLSVESEPAVNSGHVEAGEDDFSQITSKKGKKSKKKSKSSAFEDWSEEPLSKPQSDDEVQDKKLDKPLIANPTSITASAQDAPDEVKEQSTPELPADNLSEPSKDLVATPSVGDNQKVLARDIPMEATQNPQMDTQAAEQAATSAVPKVPANPFAVNLSMADAIALSMGQNVAALEAVKPKKKKKAVVGQGSTWTTWKPSAASLDQAEKVETAVSSELPASHEQQKELMTEQSIKDPDTPAARTVSLEETSRPTTDDDSSRDVLQQGLLEPHEATERALSAGVAESPPMDNIVAGDVLESKASEAQTIADAPSEEPRELQAQSEADIDDFEIPKKSKKDKKNKRKSTAAEFETNEHISTAQNIVEAEPVAPLVIDPLPTTVESNTLDNLNTQSDKGVAASDLFPQTEAPAVLESRDIHPNTDVSIPGDVEPEQSFLFTTKKSKKDKKKRKSTAAGSETPIEAPSETEPASLTEEPLTLDNKELEVDREITAHDEAEPEPSWSYSTKKSKKDKKKRASMMDTAVSVIPVEDETTDTTTRLPSLDNRTTPESTELPKDNEILQEDQTLQASDPAVDAAAEDEWTVPVKQSKKDKKKKRMSIVEVEESVTPVEDVSRTIEHDRSVGEEGTFVPTMKAAQLAEEPKAIDPDQSQTTSMDLSGENEWSLPVKMSKKDKKKKKASLMADPDDSETIASTPIIIDQEGLASRSADGGDRDVTKDQATNSFSLPQPDSFVQSSQPVDAAVPEEDEWSLPTASKKDKKKKKKSIADPSDEPRVSDAGLSTQPETTAEQRMPEPLSGISNLDRSVDEPSTTSKTLADAGDDDWAGFTMKSSKKDKKKKRKSGFALATEQDTETTSGNVSSREIEEKTPLKTADPEQPISDSVTQLPDTMLETPTSKEAVEDEWSFSGYTSKKDKKQARKAQKLGLAVAEPLSTSVLSDSPTERSKVEDPEQSNTKREDSELAERVAAIKDRSAHELHSHDTHRSWLAQANEAASSFPVKSANQEETQGISVEAVAVESRDMLSESMSEAFDTPVETEPDQEFSFAPTKKSKKDKKKKKSKATSSAEEGDVEKAVLATAASAAAVAIAATAIEHDQDTAVSEEASRTRDVHEDLPQRAATTMHLPEIKQDSMPGSFDDVREPSEEAQDESVFASAVATPMERPVQEPEEISWASAFKRSKKDKKKRKSVTWSDGDTSTPATPVNEKVLELPPTVTEDTFRTTEEPDDMTRDVHQDPTTEHSTGEVLASTEEHKLKTDLPTPVSEKEEFEWPTSGKKKSKKDKKNKGSTSEAQNITDDAVDLTQSLPEASKEPDDAGEIPEVVVAETVPEDWTESSSSSKKKKKDKKKKRTSSTYDTDQLSSDSKDQSIGQTGSEAPPDRMIIDEDNDKVIAPVSTSDNLEKMDVDSIVHEPEELHIPSPVVDAEMVEGVKDEPQKASTENLNAEQTSLAHEDDEWALPGKKSKKDKKKKKKGQLPLEEDRVTLDQAAEIAGSVAVATAVAASANAAAVEQVRDENIEQTRTLDIQEHDTVPPKHSSTAPAPVAQADNVDDDWSFDTKVSRKDKKKKKRQSYDQDVDVIQKSETVTSDAPMELSRDASLADVSSETVPMRETPEAEPLAMEQPSKTGVEYSTIPELLGEEEWSFTSKGSKKDKKKKRKSILDEVKATSEEDVSPPNIQHDISIPRTEKEIPNYVRDFSVHHLHAAPQHQGYLSTAHSIASTFPTQPSVPQRPADKSIEQETRTISSQREVPNYVRDFSVHQLHDVPQHQDYLSTAHSLATTFPSQPIPSDKDIAMDRSHEEAELAQDSDVGSNVSDETRQRRRRRRSPPLARDHDPEDLPRDRALTPPPDHDDMMDTALTIAAGLGFGESANDRSQSDSHKPQSSQPHPRHLPSLSLDDDKSDRGFLPDEYNRDSGVQFESPTMLHDSPATVRDSGFVPSPPPRDTWSKEPDYGETLRPSGRQPRPHSPTSSAEDLRDSWHGTTSESETHGRERSFTTPARRQPLPVDSASKERSSVVFNSSPAAGSTPSKTPRSDKKSLSGLKDLRAPTPEHHRATSGPDYHDHSRNKSSEPSDYHTPEGNSHERTPTSTDRAAIAPNDKTILPPTAARQHPDRPGSPSKGPLHTIHEASSPTNVAAIGGAAAALGLGAAAFISRDREDPSHSKSLGSSKTRTGSQRNLRDSATSPTNLVSNKDAVAAAGTARGMSGNDVYDGYGSFPGSPASPTRPPSVRKRQSMQQIKDLEARVDQLANENRSLAEAKLAAERHLEEFQNLGAPRSGADDEALQSAHEQLQERDHEITKLRAEITALAAEHATLKTSHDEKHTQLESSSRELVGLKSQHEELSSGMEEVVKHEIATALAEKNAELQRLRLDLENARLKIRELQNQILARAADEVVIVHDEDYFENACQNLCQHVQSWVVRFSKFSDTRVCRSMKEVRDEKVLDRFDNALLDGSDIDPYLADRVKRRDVFMSVVMTMIWEYVFTRYLFGMDRDQRQKLKQLEKNLEEVGPAPVVHQWRALTLTLLSKRPAFRAQCDNDTEAVVIEVMKALSRFLPPPQNLEAQISDSLRKVMKVAVDLSIEMRTQRAEYVMLPPLQPEYDTQGDLTQKVYFNADLMNERSGDFESNEQLEENRAVVRIVLFPLVVKKGDDDGRGDAEIVVCPAQVLVARSDKGKRPKSRIASGGSVADQRSLRAASTHSLAMSGVDMTGAGNMI